MYVIKCDMHDLMVTRRKEVCNKNIRKRNKFAKKRVNYKKIVYIPITVHFSIASKQIQNVVIMP